MSTDRDLILSRIGDVGPQVEALPVAAARASEASQDTEPLWQQFAENLAALGGEMKTLHDLWSLTDRQIWIDADASQYVGATLQAHTGDPDIWEAQVGITTADLAIAESGSLILSAGPGKRRLASLAPPLHVVVITRPAIVPTLEDAVLRVGPKTSVIITGPSRTADIEGILVRGVHGPGELWVVRV